MAITISFGKIANALKSVAADHVLGVAADIYDEDKQKYQSDLNDDIGKVVQTVTTTNSSYPLLLSPSGQTATTTTTSYFDSGVCLNPSTNTISANISGYAGHIVGGLKGSIPYQTGNNTTTMLGIGSTGQVLKVTSSGVPGWVNEYIYTLPAATTGALGGIKLGYSEVDRNYAVKLDGNNKAYVTIPWTDTTYNNATATTGGLMSAGDKSKLDGIATGANKYVHPTAGKNVGSFGTSVDTSVVNGGTLKIPYITVDSNGHVTAASDVTITLPSQYSLPIASSTALGGIKIGYGQNGKNYPVQLSDGKAYVNVPWTDTNTTYSNATATTAGLMSADDKKKLDAGNADTLDGHDSTYFATKEKVDDLEGQILALASGLTMVLTVSPAIICKNKSTSITVTATTKTSAGNTTASEIKIMDGDTVLKTVNNAATTSVAKAITTTSNTYTFKAEATVNGIMLNKTASVNARYPVYYGSGQSSADVKALSSPYGGKLIITSAIRTYSITIKTDGDRFYLLVPSDVTAPSKFTMGGAPASVNKTTETIDGVTYNVYSTNSTYNQDIKLTIEAKAS